jgi:NitT/TauT family transport system ATP-binding protein
MPGRDVELIVLPPPLMPAALRKGQIDGFCAGEPWGSVAAANGDGVIVTTNAHIWRNSPEKVLGVRWAWAEEDGERLARLVRAVFRAAVWCDAAENVGALTLLLSRPEYVGQPGAQISPSLRRELAAPDGSLVAVDGFLSFSRNAATFPWVSHALWFYSQMVRWEQAEHSEAAMKAAKATYRPDLYRAALKPLGVETPAANLKVEGALVTETAVGSQGGHLKLGPDAFFDGRTFDPDNVEAYLAALPR